MAERSGSRRRTVVLLVVIGLIIAAGVACGTARSTDRAQTAASLDDVVTSESDSEPDLARETNAFVAPTPITAPRPDPMRFAGTWTVARDRSSWLKYIWFKDDPLKPAGFSEVIYRSEEVAAEVEVLVDETLSDTSIAIGFLEAELTTLTTFDDEGDRQVSDARGVANHSLARIGLAGSLDTDTCVLDFGTTRPPKSLVIFGVSLYSEFSTLEGQCIGNDVLVISGVGTVGQLDEDSRDDCSFSRVTLLTLPPLPSTPRCVQTEGVLSFRIYLRSA